MMTKKKKITLTNVTIMTKNKKKISTLLFVKIMKATFCLSATEIEAHWGGEGELELTGTTAKSEDRGA